MPADDFSARVHIQGTDTGTISSPTHTYGASKDTYWDLDVAGVWHPVVVDNDDPEPAVTNSAVRVFKVVTDANDRVSMEGFLWPFEPAAELITWLSGTAMDDVLNTDIYSTSWTGVGYGTPNETELQTVRRAGAIQRLMRITRYFPAAEAMAQAGLFSAQQVCGSMTAQQFVMSFRAAFGSSLLAFEAYQLCQRMAGAVAVVREREAGRNLYRPAATSPKTSLESALNLATGGNGQVTWARMFGSPDACACPHDDSVSGSPAYLYDLLNFVSVDLMAATTLQTRRPDLLETKLSARNATKRLPFVDLVNETLEYLIAVNGLTLDPPPEFVSETQGDEAELRAYPQRTIGEVYDALRAMRFPRELPFDLWHEEVRLYLSAIGVNLRDLRASYEAQGPTGAASEGKSSLGWIRERLGLLEASYDSAVTTSALASDFGGLAWTAIENDVELLLRLTGYESSELSELDAALRTRLAGSEIGAAGACSLGELTVAIDESIATGLNLVLRLVQASGLSAPEIDRCLNHWVTTNPAVGTPGEQETARAQWLSSLAITLELAEILGEEPARIAQFWRLAIDTHKYPVWGSDLEDRSVYERLFFPRAVPNEEAGSPLDLSNAGTVRQSLPHIAAALNIAPATLEALAEPLAAPADTVTASFLVQLHRDATLTSALGLSPRAYLAIKALVASPFDSPAATLDLVALLACEHKTGLTAEELAWITAHVDYEGAPTSGEVNDLLYRLKEALNAEASLSDNAVVVSDALGTLLDMEPSTARLLFHTASTDVLRLAALATLDDPEDADRQAVTRLQKLALMVSALDLDAAEAQALALEDGGRWTGASTLPGSATDPAASLDAFWDLLRFCKLRGLDPDTANATARAINKANLSDTSDVAGAIAIETGWAQQEFQAILDDFSVTPTTPAAVFWAASFFVEAQRTGFVPSFLHTVAKVGSTAAPTTSFTRADAAAAVAACRASLGGKQYLEEAPKLRAGLRERQQRALVAYALDQSTALFGTTLETKNDLYNFLLLDVETTSAVSTSRLIQATASVQLLLHRAALGYESTINLDEDQALKWSWMQRYRVWEANRRIFLYPENYARPDLRRRKTTSFATFESLLLEGPLTKESAREAFGGLLDEIRDISHLYPLNIQTIRRQIGGAAYGNAEDTTFVISREGSIGGRVYMQVWRNRAFWSGWTPIDLDVNSEHVFVAKLLGELHLFWFTWGEISPQPSSVPLPKGQDDPTNRQSPDSTVEATLHFSVLRRGHWSKPRRCNGTMLFPRARNNDTVERFAASVRLHLRVTETEAFFQAQRRALYIPTEDDIARLNAYANAADLYVLRPYLDKLEEEVDRINALIGTTLEWHQGLYFSAVKSTSIPYEVPLHEREDWRWGGRAVEIFQRIDLAESDRCKVLLTESHGVSGPLVPLSTKLGTISLVLDPTERQISTANPLIVQRGTHSFVVAANGGSVARDGATYVPPAMTPDYRSFQRYRDLDTLAEFSLQSSISETLVSFAQPSVTQRSAAPGLAVTRGRTVCQHSVQGVEPFLPTADHESQRLTAKFLPMFMAETDTLKRAWETQPMQSFFSREIQEGLSSRFAEDFSLTFGPTDQVDADYPSSRISFDLNQPYGMYGWELFFHAPARIASEFFEDGQFEEAREWLHCIFNPTRAKDGVGSAWRFKPFHDWTLSSRSETTALLTSSEVDPATKARKAAYSRELTVWAENPFDAHEVAQVRIEAYMRWAVFLYVDILIGWGDRLFEEDTFESVNQAAQLYVLAQQVLGREPVLLDGAVKTAQTYEQLTDGVSDSDLYLECVVGTTDEVTFEADARDDAPPTPSSFSGPDDYFCTPANDRLTTYWRTVADRLFKIRNSLNIHGVKRTLALVAPPIDPLLLARARARGVPVEDLISTIGTSQVRPPYRFQVVAQQALELCGHAQSLGSLLLSAIERQDGERLAQLQREQAVELTTRARRRLEEALKESQAQLEGLQANRLLAETRQAYYASRKELNAREQDQLNLIEASFVMQTSAQALLGVASGSALLPDATIGAQGWGATPVAELKHGGKKAADALNYNVNMLQAVASALSDRASRAGVRAAHQRRFEDFQHQKRLAEIEIQNVDAQIAAAEVRVALNEHELDLHALQLEQERTMESTLRAKYSNKELYAWMVGKVQGLYKRAYDLALQMARRAEACYNFELGRSQASTEVFLKSSYWDSYRKGLLAGEELAHDIRRMQAAYTVGDVRELEHTAHFSLAEHQPLKLLELLGAGSASSVSLTEDMYDRLYLGQTKRRVRSVAVTVYGVAGPMEGVRLKLTQASSQVRYTSAEDAINGTLEPVTTPAAEVMITTTGLQDAMVEQDDGRYLPFERTGAISDWALELDLDANGIERSSVRDIVFHVRYTAVAGHPDRVDARRTSLFSGDLGTHTYAISLRSQRPDTWAALTASPEASARSADFALLKEELPVRFAHRQLEVADLEFYGVLKGNASAPTVSMSAWAWDGSAPSSDAPLAEWSATQPSHEKYRVLRTSTFDPTQGSHGFGDAAAGELWSVRVSDSQATSVLEDVILLVTVQEGPGDPPPPPPDALIESTTWAHAWDFSAAPTSAGNVPAYTGAVPLTLTAGNYTVDVTTGPLTADGISSERLDKAIQSDTSDYARFDATDAGFAFTTGIHVRAIVKNVFRTDANGYICRLGTTSGDRLELFQAADGRIFMRFHVNGGAFLHQWIIESPPDDWLLIDAIARTDPSVNSGASLHTELMVNGRSQGGVTGVQTYTGITNGDVDVMSLNGASSSAAAILFLGIETTESFAFAAHQSDFEASFDGAAFVRTFDHAFTATSLAATGDWDADVGGLALSRTGTLTLDRATTGLLPAGIGAANVNKAVLPDDNTAFQFAIASASAAAKASGDATWIRIIARAPASGSGLTTLFSRQESTQIIDQVLLDKANGRPRFDLYDNDTTADQVTDTVTRSGNWLLIDAYVSGTGEMDLYVNGTHTNGPSVTDPLRAVSGTPAVELLKQAAGEILFIGLADGANADAFSNRVHLADGTAMGVI